MGGHNLVYLAIPTDRRQNSWWILLKIKAFGLKTKKSDWIFQFLAQLHSLDLFLVYLFLGHLVDFARGFYTYSSSLIGNKEW